MAYLNYSNIVSKVEKKLHKMEETLLNTHWQITVLETLILPRFTDIFMSIPDHKII